MEEKLHLAGHDPLDEGLVIVVGSGREGAPVVLQGLDLGSAVLAAIPGLCIDL